MLRAFYRFILRPLRREPARTALTVLAVALGVAVVLAIELAGEAAAGSFRSSVETLAGETDLEIAATGGFDEALLGQLVALPGSLTFEPRLESYATLTPGNEVIPLIGIDLIAGALKTGRAATPADGFDRRDAVWVGQDLGRKAGDSITLQIEDRVATYSVAGVLPQPGRMAVTDILIAQKLLGREGKLDRILITIPESDEPELWRERIARMLPEGVTVQPSGARTRENQKMLGAFRWNLRVLSYISLIVGAFLIYNTISVSVVRRRAEIGILRAVGATRTWILGAFLGEGVLFGLAGAFLGVFLGRAMAEGAVRLIGSTVESLYVSSAPDPIRLTPVLVLLALVAGICISIISAIAPAREAAAVQPIEAMARGRTDYLSRVRRGRSLAIAAILAAASFLASQLPPLGSRPIGGYVAALLLIAAGAFAMPAVVASSTAALSPFLQRIAGVEAMLAARSLAATLRRTSVLVGALTTAIAMMVSVGIMVGSFRSTVAVWMDGQLRADLFIRPAGPASADRFPTISSATVDRIAALPEVREVDRFRAYPAGYNGLPVTIAGGETASIPPDERPPLAAGDRDSAMDRLPTCDCVIVSEPFAYKHNVRPGQQLHLQFGSFEVLGIYHDYANERGYIVMDRRTLLKYLPDPAPSSLAVWLKPGVDPEQARGAVENAAEGSNLAIFPSRTLRVEALRVFDRTFAITYALQAVAILVAVTGVAGALIALVIDRRRELGLLRFLGASLPQIRRLIVAEAALLGLLSSAAGAILGILLSWILIFVINKQSFGWTIQLHWPLAALALALAGVYLATLLSSLYPARLAARLNPIEVVHEE